MPPAAFIKEEEIVVPPMPPSAVWGVKVEDAAPLLSDAVVKRERAVVDEDRPVTRKRTA